MKNLKMVVVLFTVGAIVILSAPGKISGFQNPGTGEYANVAPLKHGDWKTPPGHYGLMALYADGYLSQAQANGNYQVTWSFVQPNLTEYYVVDVRPKTAYDTSHIIGAVNIPYATVAKPHNLDKLPTEQPILLYCGTGLTSSQVAPILGMMGYQVRVLTTPFAQVPVDYKEAS